MQMMEIAGLNPSMASIFSLSSCPLKLTGISAQGFHVAALSFGEDGVEGERGFAGSGYACKDNNAIAREVEVDVFEVMLSGSAYGDGVGHFWGGVFLLILAGFVGGGFRQRF